MDTIQVVCPNSSGSEDPAMEGTNDISASQQLFGSQGQDESGEEASSAGLELLCPQPAAAARGWKALNSMLHVLPLDCTVGTVKSLKG